MKLPHLFAGVMEFVPPSLALDEWESPDASAFQSFDRDSGEWTSGIRGVTVKALEWTAAAPTKPGWYWCRKVGGGTDYIAIRIEAGDSYWPGLEFAGPLPTPRAGT